MTIKIEASDYQEKVANRLKAYGKKASIKGFRPGYIPHTLLQQMYGRTILMEEVQTLLDTSLANYLKEKEIDIVGAPIPAMDYVQSIDWAHQRNFEIEYHIGMAGKFTCELAKHIQVTAYKINEVSPQTLAHLITQLRKSYGQVTVVPKSTPHDVLYGTLHYPPRKLQIQTQIDLEKIATEEMRAIFIDRCAEDRITWDVQKGLSDLGKLQGVTEEMTQTMLQLGGQAVFSIEQVQRTSPAALEQAFFDKVLGTKSVHTVQDFNSALQARLLQHKQQRADFFLERSIQDTLLDKTPIALPDAFLQRWLRQKRSTSVPNEQITAYYQQYAKELRWRLLAASISKTHDIQVTHDEIVEKVKQQLQESVDHHEGTPKLTAQNITRFIHQLLQKDNGKYYNEVREGIHWQKLFNFIKAQITLHTQEISVEAFDRLALE